MTPQVTRETHFEAEVFRGGAWIEVGLLYSETKYLRGWLRRVRKDPKAPKVRGIRVTSTSIIEREVVFP